jgi:ATP-binding cassette subfamily B protein/subfamily B ATP-binding cassette protein MsbA
MVSARPRSRFREIFAAHLGRVKGGLTVAGLCTLGVTLTDLAKPWPLKVIIDYGLLHRPLPHALTVLQPLAARGDVTFILVMAATIVAISVLAGAFSYFQIYITSAIGYRTVYALRRELFAHLQSLSLTFHTQARSGDLLTKIAGDTNTLKDLFADSLLKFSSQLLTVVGMLIILFTVNWKIGAIALGTMPFLSYSLFHVYRKTKISVKTQKRQEGQVASRMGEVLSAVPLVQAFARETHEIRRFDLATQQTVHESIRVARLEAAATRSAEIITALGTAIAVLFGALEVLRGTMLPGELVLVVAYLNNMYKPMKNMAKLSTDVSKAMASVERISEVLDIEPEIHDRPDAIEAQQLRGAIEFDHVSFDYGDGRAVLRDVSFKVAPGQTLALVGASGAGKSTIVSLILRLYEPQGGVIRIDGEDIQHYKIKSLRRHTGLVLQQAILFGATVRENIAYGRPDATDAEIEAAAWAANADEFIRDMEEGYDTVIGERGATLSGGQRQRIAIARALIRDAPILILDEPMTGLDAESEGKVREALDRLMQGKTCIMITHDLPAIADADLVLLLEDGRIAESGRHRDLVQSSVRYRQLYELQAPAPTAAS